jgi:hypothetical protein
MNIQNSGHLNISVKVRTRVMELFPLGRAKKYEHFDTKYSFISKIKVTTLCY